MTIFQCVLKQDCAGIGKGTTIQVVTPHRNLTENRLQAECVHQYGPKAAAAGKMSLWTIHQLYGEETPSYD